METELYISGRMGGFYNYDDKKKIFLIICVLSVSDVFRSNQILWRIQTLFLWRVCFIQRQSTVAEGQHEPTYDHIRLLVGLPQLALKATWLERGLGPPDGVGAHAMSGQRKGTIQGYRHSSVPTGIIDGWRNTWLATDRTEWLSLRTRADHDSRIG